MFLLNYLLLHMTENFVHSYYWANDNSTLRISVFHLAFFNSIIDKNQHMHFFTFKTVLV